ncbi:hypothetical protein [Usitatibacter rugosus]|uniref:hypothetical protein n=1 Tax=Usitatibacter rugosus TaxID=2732067 RepID=UPI001489E7DB|nr:hypothetical protein [Usitatibacter rugosus]
MSGDPHRAYLLLIGSFDLIFIGTERVAKHVTTLHRRSDWDRSFSRSEVYERDAFLIFLYEGGICRISYDGQLAWHSRLFWDDLLVRASDSEFIFANEHANDGREWSIDLSAGHRSSNAPAAP